MVIDTSALLAVFFNEVHGTWVAENLSKNSSSLRMSTVNLDETLILVKDRQPQEADTIENLIQESSIRFVPPSYQQAKIASMARLKYPLNLGGCFAYALCKDEGAPLLTLDSDFKKTEPAGKHITP